MIDVGSLETWLRRLGLAVVAAGAKVPRGHVSVLYLQRDDSPDRGWVVVVVV